MNTEEIALSCAHLGTGLIQTDLSLQESRDEMGGSYLHEWQLAQKLANDTPRRKTNTKVQRVGGGKKQYGVIQMPQQN